MSRMLGMTAAIVFTLITAPTLNAQEMRRSGGRFLPPYDAAKEMKVVGEVTGTEIMEVPSGPMLLIVSLKVDGKPLHIMLGPQGWLKEQGVAVTTGQKVEATGVTEGLHFKGDTAMIVRLIKIGAVTSVIRDTQGTPMWEKS